MLRLQTENGWWLVTHPDHARLAGAFAARWGNERFQPPEPRERVLKGISCHDDGWAARDAKPQITRQGRPSAFSAELVGKYSAFEEIDLADYLAVRDRAVRLIAEQDPYAAILISMHTYNLLTEHADRSTVAVNDLPLLDTFLREQEEFQNLLRLQIAGDASIPLEGKSDIAIRDHFRLLQATDNLSLLTCVDFKQPAHLLHPLPLRDGTYTEVAAWPVGNRHFVLKPYPFAENGLTFEFPARNVEGSLFGSAEEFQARLDEAKVVMLSVELSEG